MFAISPLFAFQQIFAFSVNYLLQLRGILSSWSTAKKMREHIWPAWFLLDSEPTYHAESDFCCHLTKLPQYQNVLD
jgi:hypothetical protein